MGFSGGEKKKIGDPAAADAHVRALQSWTRPIPAWMWTPSALVSKGVEEYQKDRDGALLIITHSTRILESLHVDYTHVMVNGQIVATGDAFHGGRDQRKRIRALSEQCSGRR